MKKYGFCILILVMVSLALPTTTTHAQDDACSDLVLDAYVLTKQSCDDTSQDEACYGNTALFASPITGITDFTFNTPGDIVNVGDIQSLRMSEMNERTGEWGISLMRIRANLAPDITDNVELLLFGDVSLDNVGGSDTGYGPMQAFYFSSGIDDRLCNEAPNSGIMIQTPKGVGTVTLLINEVVVELGSTAYLQADPGDQMTVNVVEGEGRVTAFGTTVTVPAGTRSNIPLATNGGASAPPSQPEPYSNADLITLPVSVLSRPIIIAPAQEDTSTSGNTQTQPQVVTATSVPAVEPFIIRGAIIANGGLQIYEEPTTQSERLYASLGGFNPTIIGRTEDSRWVDIFFCVSGRVIEGWTLSSRIVFDADDLERLAVTDPEPPFVVPDITCTSEMTMPIGSGGAAPAPVGTEEAIDEDDEDTEPIIDGNIGIFEVYDCVYIGNNTYEWYRAQAEVDEHGVQIGQHEYIGGPFTGPWRPGCPGTPTPTPTITPTHFDSALLPNNSEVASASPTADSPSLAMGSVLAGVALVMLTAARVVRRRED